MNDRLIRLLWSGKLLVKYLLLAPFRPSAARAFLAHIYFYEPIPLCTRISSGPLPTFLPAVRQDSVIMQGAFSEHGNMTHEELYNLCLLLKHKDAKTVFEFGTFNGNTTFHLALNGNPSARILTLNLPGPATETEFSHSAEDRKVVRDKTRSGERFHGTPQAAKIQELFGDSATFDYSPFRNSIEFALIDAGHEYEYVKNDTEKALVMVKPGGMLVWHDFPNAPGVARYLTEISTQFKVMHISGTRLAFAWKQ